MAKAAMQIGTKVYVDPVGCTAVIKDLVCLWEIGKRDPVKIYYDCGLGRPFSEYELTPLYGQPREMVGQQI